MSRGTSHVGGFLRALLGAWFGPEPRYPMVPPATWLWDAHIAEHQTAENWLNG